MPVYSGGKFGAGPWNKFGELEKWPDPAAHWIWTTPNPQIYAPIGKVVMKKTFMGPPCLATIYATCDYAMTVYFNGFKVLTGKDWNKIYRATVPIMPMNTIRVEAENLGGPAGLLLTVIPTPIAPFGPIARSDTSWSKVS